MEKQIVIMLLTIIKLIMNNQSDDDIAEQVEVDIATIERIRDSLK